MSKYATHQAFLKKVILYIQGKYPDARLWEIATGQAYAKFSVKNAIKYAIKTKDIMGALKKLVVIVYGKIGHPDITGIYKGIWIGIEIKTGKAKQNTDQKNFQKMIEKAGGVYVTIRDSKPIRDQIEKFEQIKNWAEKCQ